MEQENNKRTTISEKRTGKGFFIVFLPFYLLCIRLDDAKLTQGHMGGILLSILLV